MNNYPDLTNDNNPNFQQPLLNPNHNQGHPNNPNNYNNYNNNPGYNNPPPNYNPHPPGYNAPPPIYVNTNPNPIYVNPTPVYANPSPQIHVHHNYNAPKPEPPRQERPNVIIVPVRNEDDDLVQYHPNSMPLSSIKIKCRFCGNKNFTKVNVSRDNMMIVLIIICILMASLIIPLFFMCSYIQAYIDSEKWEHSCSHCGKYVGQGSKK